MRGGTSPHRGISTMLIEAIKEYKFIIILVAIDIVLLSCIYVLHKQEQSALASAEVIVISNQPDKPVASQQKEPKQQEHKESPNQYRVIREAMDSNKSKYPHHSLSDVSVVKQSGDYSIVSAKITNTTRGFSAVKTIILRNNTIITGLDDLRSSSQLSSMGVPKDIVAEYSRRLSDV